MTISRAIATVTINFAIAVFVSWFIGSLNPYPDVGIITIREIVFVMTLVFANWVCWDHIVNERHPEDTRARKQSTNHSDGKRTVTKEELK